MSASKTLYFDHNATTPVDPRVLEAMLPYFNERFGNSMSLSHSYGWDAETAVEKARRQAGELLHAAPQDLTFTSGATESNNWAIEGVIESIRLNEGPATPIHLLVSPLEHNSILQAAKRAERLFNVELDLLPINAYGQVDVSRLHEVIKPHTRLMAVMWVQNEVGSINDIPAISEFCREHRIYLLCDATQAVGKLPIDLQKTKVDLLSFSAHKFSGPKGVGMLYKRSKDPHVQLSPMIAGGGHERGARSGTLNVPGIVGLGAACEIARLESRDEHERLRSLRDLLWQKLQASFPTVRLNGHPTERAASNLHVTFQDHTVPVTIKGLAASRGSACHSGHTSISHTLKALGFSEESASQSLRLTLGRTTTREDVLEAAELLSLAIKPKSLSFASPLPIQDGL